MILSGLLPPQLTPRQVYNKICHLQHKSSHYNMTQNKRLKLATIAFAPVEAEVSHGSDHEEDGKENNELKKIDVVQPGSDHEEADEESNELEKGDVVPQPYLFPFLKMALEGMEKLMFEEVVKQGLVDKHILDELKKKWKDFSVKTLKLRSESFQLHEQSLKMLIDAIQKKYADM